MEKVDLDFQDQVEALVLVVELKHITFQDGTEALEETSVVAEEEEAEVVKMDL